MMPNGPWQEIIDLYNEHGPDRDLEHWAVNIFFKKPIVLWSINGKPLDALYGCAITGVGPKWIKIKAFDKIETWVRKNNIIAVTSNSMPGGWSQMRQAMTEAKP